jgi:hypothetical protein
VNSDIKPVAKFLVSDLGDIVDNPMPESTISRPHSQGLSIWPLIIRSPFASLWGGSFSVDFIFMTMLGSKEKSHILFSSIITSLILNNHKNLFTNLQTSETNTDGKGT